MLGIDGIVGLEFDPVACATAQAAGFIRHCVDVAAVHPSMYAGAVGLIGSPPCQAWSRGGKQLGRVDQQACHELADRMATGDDDTTWRDWADPRSPLVCQPVRWVRELRPEWVALEEVPAVLPLWEHFARIFQTWGYSTWVGVLNSADYGVPQTRKRAILIASRTRTVSMPEPTHSRDAATGTDRWVSMADALGWGFDNEPSATVSGGGAATGGAEPFANANYRRRLAEHVRAQVQRVGEPRDADWVCDRPATTIVGSFCPDVVSAPGYRTTVSRQNAPGSVRITVAEAGVLQSFPADFPWHGPKTKAHQQVGNAVPPLLAFHVLRAAGADSSVDDIKVAA